MKLQIFLSASIPVPGREPFDRDTQTKRIRDAVLALVTVCRDRDLILTFGGHPAISPLVHHAAESLGVMKIVYIYQSEFYRKFIPEAAWKFPNLIWTPDEKTGPASVAAMRDAMINKDRWKYDAAVFIGGMEGIFDEAWRFHTTFPGQPMIPLQYTGGATRLLIKEFEGKEGFLWKFPLSEENAISIFRYRRLLDNLLQVP